MCAFFHDSTALTAPLGRGVIYLLVSLNIDFFASRAAAVDFESVDEIESFDSSSDDDESSAMPQLDADQHELRVANQNNLGLGIGESTPYVSLSLEYFRIFNETRAFFIGAGRGAFSSTVQKNGDETFSNKVSSSVFQGGLVFWPSRNFPYAVAAALSTGSVSGAVQTRAGNSGRYHLNTLGVGADLQLETFFENRVWLKWVLFSGRYFRVVKGDYSNMTGAQMEVVRDSFNGLKLVGVTNLTVGYSW
jgi:hypothetical protein